MFKSCRFSHSITNPNGNESYRFHLIDTDFDLMFEIERYSPRLLICKLVDIYESRKMRVAENLSRFYVWKYNWTQVLVVIGCDIYEIRSMMPKSKFNQYSRCIKHQIKARAWARGKNV